MKKVGTIVNTHGLKGEIRILSGGRFSNNDFSSEMKKIIVDGKEYIIKKYRFHKKFHQVILEGFDDINAVEFLKGKSVFVDEEDTSVDFDQVISTPVFLNGKEIGKVESISHTKLYKLLNLDTGQVIPVNSNFIVELNLERIEVKNI